MANRRTIDPSVLLYSFDAGNGDCKGISTDVRDVIRFEPVIAPMTDRRGVVSADERPDFSLRLEDEIYVFGLDDVEKHGVPGNARRFNALERYQDSDYRMLIDVLYLQTFGAYRNGSDVIKPTGAISLPISQYNDDSVRDTLKDSLIGKRVLEDYDGCELRLDIDSKRLAIVPESYGALMHYAFDPVTLARREGAALAGQTLVIDVGYLTTDVSMFNESQYQRAQTVTLPDMGMKQVVTAVMEYGIARGLLTDETNTDLAIRPLAGVAAGAPKQAALLRGRSIEVGNVYDTAVRRLAQKIAQAVRSTFPKMATRALLAGGGAYHLKGLLADLWKGTPVIQAPDPELANVYGAFTGLKQKASK